MAASACDYIQLDARAPLMSTDLQHYVLYLDIWACITSATGNIPGRYTRVLVGAWVGASLEGCMQPVGAVQGYA